ncbi:MFS transporter [Dongia deserti]|uniref:MFS transporter n=1 Tax=Dongia deserti TaxID=2268030 RepID=UPI000E6495A7|nr:MFS transporter [Dongia deserti]
MTQSTAQATIGWRDLLLGPRRAAVWTICLGVSLHAFNWFVVNTITPSAVLELGGAELLSWVTAFFLVFSIVGSSGAAFLKGRLGLRAVLIGSSLLAIAGSLIIAVAPNMEVLLVGRIVQGFAEGIIMALCYVIAADAVGEDALPPLFGLLAAVWALATVGGPILGGALAHLWSWRIAAASLAPLAIIFLVLALIVLPARPKADGGKGWPLLRLIFLTGGSLAICVASKSETPLLAAAIVLAGLVALWIGLRIDRHARSPLFPARLLSARPASSLGLWIIGLMPLAEASVFLFIPYVGQVHLGLNVMHAGQMASIVALAWSFSAMLVARLAEKQATRLIVLGPAVLTFGMFMLAWAVNAETLLGTAIALAACGIGFGISNGFICQRTIGTSGNAERDVTSGAIPTFEGLGAALGAAFSGIIAIGAGFPELDSSTRPIVWSFVIGGLLGLPAILAAIRFARQTSSVSLETQPAE